MTTIVGTPATTTSRHSAGTALTRGLPWLLPFVVAVIGLLSVDVPIGAILRYLAYVGLTVVIPGVLLLRALWRSTGNWAEDVGLGGAVGATFKLLGWALFTALGWQSWLAVWPALVIVAFAAVPRLRRHWRIAEPKPLPLLWTWGLVIATVLLFGGATFGVMAYHPMPPNGMAYYPDLLYHLSMVNELIRAVPPELPQAAGLRLDYHWFANADMASAVDITRLSPIIVLYRLWLLPTVLIALLTFAVLARTVSRAWWTGVLAAAVFAGPQLPLWWNTKVDLWPPLSLLSPSQTFGMIMGATAAVFLIELLFRSGQPKTLWALALTVAIVGGGSKPTVLPVLVGAVGLAALFLLIRDRRLPVRFLAAGSLLVASAIGTMITVAGSTSGSGIQLLAVVKVSAGYGAATHDRSQPGQGGWILPALASGHILAVIGAVVVFGLLLVTQATAAAGYGLLALRETRRDPLAWFLLGALIAGWAGYLLVDHPSVSESYFVRTAVPFSIAAIGWVAVVQAKKHRPTPVLVPAALVLGALYAFLLLWGKTKPHGNQLSRIIDVGRPLIAVLILTAVLRIAWPSLVKVWPSAVGLGGVLALLTILAVPTAFVVAQDLHLRGGTQSKEFTSRFWQVHPDEAAAAIWLAHNSRPKDVVAGNAYCRPAGLQQSGCDARGYIISGIAGRRTLIDGWAYTSQAMANQGAGGLRYTKQPSPWPDRVAITEEALYAPNPQVLYRLRHQYGVRWLYADRRDGPVSARLDHLASLRHREDQVGIYELKQ
ncbi:hypothetical protein EV138_5550 [Kribbella voronezhensis]|uniref:4-amino-4-deoxy-L-arabinose transferase-like glycosyltransferase n=1 Tax=Kribbella voronezhensis TaxID=2512212 RepID=A0A4R7TK37_9ACTN|nr:hypothetical protein [Kribbella voronezhensis]TDU91937.1 hypothetical protein EV138_5550 [Kribbella voronezhensis]